jgi:hypothetical protein
LEHVIHPRKNIFEGYKILPLYSQAYLFEKYINGKKFGTIKVRILNESLEEK